MIVWQKEDLSPYSQPARSQSSEKLVGQLGFQVPKMSTAILKQLNDRTVCMTMSLCVNTI